MQMLESLKCFLSHAGRIINCGSITSEENEPKFNVNPALVHQPWRLALASPCLFVAANDLDQS